MFLLVKLVHILSAVWVVGGGAYYYFVLRKGIDKIPPTHAAEVQSRVGIVNLYSFLVAYVLLGVTGLARLGLRGRLPLLEHWSFYVSDYGLAISLMMLGWVGAFGAALFILSTSRKKLLRRLPPHPFVTYDDAVQYRTDREKAGTRVDRLSYLAVVFAALALLGGVVASVGGFPIGH